MLENKKILVTGAAGFIGSYLCMKLLKDYKGVEIIGVDNLNDYYDVALKVSRIHEIEKIEGSFKLVKMDIADKSSIERLFNEHKFDIVVNLAAQAGVRYSIDHPDAYISSNIIGFYNILEACRYNKPEHLVYASSSSVYGGNTKIPFSTDDKVDNPVSLYAATKKTDELLAYSYSKLYDIPSTGLRFFTVYGPAGRPDMAYFSFTNKLVNNEKIKIFNYGNCQRDFTYVENVVEANLKACLAPGEADGEAFNIAYGGREYLIDIYYTLTKALHKPIEPHFGPDRKGDIKHSNADISKAKRLLGYDPDYDFAKGLNEAIAWYRENL